METWILLSLVYILGARLAGGSGEHEDVGGVDPFEEILEYLNVTDTSGFTETRLQEVVAVFVNRFHCDADRTPGPCQHNYCLNMTLLLTGCSGLVDEECWGQVSIDLLAVAPALSGSCHSEVRSSSTSFEERRLWLTGNISADGRIDVERFQEYLDMLDLEASDSQQEHTDEDEHSENEHLEDEHSEDGHSEDEHTVSKSFNPNCLGADVVFHEMALPVERTANFSNLAHLASLVVLHIVRGWPVSRECRLLPWPQFFTDHLLETLGAVNDTVTEADLEQIFTALEIGSVQPGAHAGHDDAHRRRRREADHSTFLLKHDWETTCYTADQLYSVFSVDPVAISGDDIGRLCPAILQQKLAGSCVKDAEKITVQGPTDAEKYGYGTLATLIVCACSAVGAVFVRCAGSVAHSVLMSVFLGLAVGTLYADALLHLIPVALGVDSHGDEEGMEEEEHEAMEPYVWFSLLTCAGIYVFYLFEKLITLYRPSFLRYQSDPSSGGHGHSHSCMQTAAQHGEAANGQVVVVDQAYQKGFKSFKENDLVDQEKVDTVSNMKHKPQKQGLSTIAVMVIVGDAIHNFVDGMALGAAFSTRLSLGVATTIAVFCHELPHELGDFAILLSSGLSFGRALAFNFLSSLTALAGLFVGLAAAADDSVKLWIVAITAGMFLYIALVNMLPQLLLRSEEPVRDFLLNNVGILLGVAMMLILAIFEEKIQL
ncbi:zinc transporter ZIP4-like [Mya arenaria]|uniref:zinc transporter ZIP4-like n=1 Tax=Mya arenaria TaxID=6604 RepID=UPI0022E8746B|nr:zinc transporter ZIP4-like [Mya arenaria]